MPSAASFITPCLHRQGLVEQVRGTGLTFTIKPLLKSKAPALAGGEVLGGFGVRLMMDYKGRAEMLPFIHLKTGFDDHTLLHEMGHFLSWRLFLRTGRHVLGIFTGEEQGEMRRWVEVRNAWPISQWQDFLSHFGGKVSRGDDELVAEFFALYLCDEMFPKLLREKLALMVRLLKGG